jgi:hypothetical protein
MCELGLHVMDTRRSPRDVGQSTPIISRKSVVQGMFVAAYFTARRDTLCSLCETIMSQFKTFKVLTYT